MKLEQQNKLEPSVSSSGLFFKESTKTRVIKRLDAPIHVDMILSQYQASPEERLYKNLSVACVIVNQVRAVLSTSTTHPDVNSWSFTSAQIAKFKLGMVRYVSAFLSLLIMYVGYPYDDGYTSSIFAEFFGAGNCYEYSYLALHKLKKHDPSMYAEVYLIKNGDHIFLVMDRDPSSDPNDFKTWGKYAVVCDAWGGDVFPAYEIPHRLMDFKKTMIDGVKKNELVHYVESQGLRPDDLSEYKSLTYYERIAITLAIFYCLSRCVDYYVNTHDLERSGDSSIRP